MECSLGAKRAAGDRNDLWRYVVGTIFSALGVGAEIPGASASRGPFHARWHLRCDDALRFRDSVRDDVRFLLSG